MSERDRKQIVAEVNILKDLNHAHIVRYHDRYVDRDAGILYILMEYCGGGKSLLVRICVGAVLGFWHWMAKTRGNICSGGVDLGRLSRSRMRKKRANSFVLRRG